MSSRGNRKRPEGSGENQMSNIRRAVVTGGAGFLGSHLCQALLERGSEVICLDNFLTGTADPRSGARRWPGTT